MTSIGPSTRAVEDAVVRRAHDGLDGVGGILCFGTTAEEMQLGRPHGAIGDATVPFYGATAAYADRCVRRFQCRLERAAAPP
jgi:hypothetical protein